MKKILAFVLATLFVLSLTACSKKAATQTTTETENNVAVTDKHGAVVFSSSVDELTNLFGEGKAEKTDTSENKLTGLAVVRFFEFTGDNKPELVTVYNDKDNADVYWMEVTGFDAGSANLKFWDDSTKIQIASKSSADAAAPCVWFFTDDTGYSYIVAGEDLSKSADYYGYVQMRDGEKVYKFDKAFTETNGNLREGTYEKIEFVGMSDEDVKKNFEKNQQAIEAIEKAK